MPECLSNKVEGLLPETSLKKRIQYRCVPVNKYTSVYRTFPCDCSCLERTYLADR